MLLEPFIDNNNAREWRSIIENGLDGEFLARRRTAVDNSVMIDYFFFDDFLLLPPLDFFAEALPPFFEAISAHHLSCRTGPPGRASGHIAPNRFG